MKKQQICELVSKQELAAGIFDFKVHAPQIAAEMQSGQFLHIDCGEGTFLRRPISICDVEGENVRFIFEVKGKGTQDLARKSVGEFIDIMGPLGHGFELRGQDRHPVIIGGGIGIFPLYHLAKQMQAEVFLGFRDQSRVVMEEEFKQASRHLTVATDDGSYGYAGYAAEAMEQYLDKNPCDIIYSCGPTPMLRVVKRIAEQRKIDCQLSLEQRMGCGIGACLVCTCETNQEGTDRYKRVCKNGPVFWASEVTLND